MSEDHVLDDGPGKRMEEKVQHQHGARVTKLQHDEGKKTRLRSVRFAAAYGEPERLRFQQDRFLLMTIRRFRTRQIMIGHTCRKSGANIRRGGSRGRFGC